MIQLTRLNSEEFALNTDLIERLEATPDTVLTLIDGTKYVVSEPIEEVIDRVIQFRARVVATSGEMAPVVPLHLVDSDGAEEA